MSQNADVGILQCVSFYLCVSLTSCRYTSQCSDVSAFCRVYQYLRCQCQIIRK